MQTTAKTRTRRGKSGREDGKRREAVRTCCTVTTEERCKHFPPLEGARESHHGRDAGGAGGDMMSSDGAGIVEVERKEETGGTGQLKEVRGLWPKEVFSIAFAARAQVTGARGRRGIHIGSRSVRGCDMH